MNAVYVTGGADQDEIELQRHLVATKGGRCEACGEQEPCSTRQRLAAVLAESGRLPRRRPGEVGERMFHPPVRKDRLAAGGQHGALVDEVDAQQ